MEAIDPSVLLAPLTRRINTNRRGLERLEWIATNILRPASPEWRAVMRKFIDDHLLQQQAQHSSDVEFGGRGGGGRIWIRQGGIKQPLEGMPPLSEDGFNLLVMNVLSDGQQDALIRQRNVDFSYTVHDNAGASYRFRADAYLEMETAAVNFRIIDSSLRTIDSYRFSPSVLRMLNLANTKEGLILVTGITGSGKSSTLDAIIDYNNRNVSGHIVIIASPLEFIHQSKRCLIRHREVGRDTLSFKSGIIEALRQDPDVIVIGEMRDPETIMAALEAADSGHKVISTLHTSSAIESIERIIAEMPSVEQDRVRMRLATVLKCVISQKLVPSLGGGLILAREVMVSTPSIQAAIRNNNADEVYQMLAEGRRFGMSTMEQDLKVLFTSGKISLDTVDNYANNKRMMGQIIQAAA